MSDNFFIWLKNKKLNWYGLLCLNTNNENYLNPFPERRDEITLLSQEMTQTIEPSESILHRAEQLEQANIKSMDAVLLACAEVFECDFLLTCDDKLIKKANRLTLKLEVCNPINFIQKVTEEDETT